MAYFTVKVYDFSKNSILHVHQNTLLGVKYFPEIIYTQNKHNLQKLQNHRLMN